MEVEKMLEELRQERSMIEEAIVALERIMRSGTVAPKRRGRPPKALSAVASATAASKKRELSPEGRARIAEAAKKRWAEARAKKSQS
jgi:hypothetical protein